jgi:hypothetical protein
VERVRLGGGHHTRVARGSAPTDGSPLGPRAVRLAPRALARHGLLIEQGHRNGGALESQVDERRQKLTGGGEVHGGLR